MSDAKCGDAECFGKLLKAHRTAGDAVASSVGSDCSSRRSGQSGEDVKNSKDDFVRPVYEQASAQRLGSKGTVVVCSS